jgi:hypothetical protein
MPFCAIMSKWIQKEQILWFCVSLYFLCVVMLELKYAQYLEYDQ